MTKGKAVFGLVVVLALAGGAARLGMLGNPDELAKWFPPIKWFSSDHAAAQTQPSGPRPVAVEVATAVKKKTPVMLEITSAVALKKPSWRSSPGLEP